eukprot:CAMPEP_0194046134 /NCGR_PEP_ID=MMETSP0009_2-20130614/19735_1 /TAXON_ID=210454 /ORGANISM="Grammatophora oceanica, Strain CCMP 410" /LENGTH=295 /DNA_ID=CAMNT_0038691301 /DNA_START=70 /DNA_END=956 /DNA_ORIENTATION=+
MAQTIVLPFSVEAFNQVSDYFDVRKYGDRDKKLYDMLETVNAFGSLFCEHNMETIAGLSLSHRHFDLKEGELKVAIQESDQLLRIKATPTHAIPAGAKVLPYLFQPIKDDDGVVRLVPLEYVIHKDPKHIKALEREIKAICDPAFLHNFWNLGESQGVQGLYGIFLQSRHFLRYSSKKEGTVEGTGDGDRSLEVKVVPKTKILEEPDTTTVGWSFRKDGETGRVIPVSACSSLGHGNPDEEDDTLACSVCPSLQSSNLSPSPQLSLSLKHRKWGWSFDSEQWSYHQDEYLHLDFA